MSCEDDEKGSDILCHRIELLLQIHAAIYIQCRDESFLSIEILIVIVSKSFNYHKS